MITNTIIENKEALNTGNVCILYIYIYIYRILRLFNDILILLGSEKKKKKKKKENTKMSTATRETPAIR